MTYFNRRREEIWSRAGVASWSKKFLQEHPLVLLDKEANRNAHGQPLTRRISEKKKRQITGMHIVASVALCSRPHNFMKALGRPWRMYSMAINKHEQAGGNPCQKGVGQNSALQLLESCCCSGIQGMLGVRGLFSPTEGALQCLIGGH